MSKDMFVPVTVTEKYIDYNCSVYSWDNVAKMPETKNNVFLKVVYQLKDGFTFDNMLNDSQKKVILNILHDANVSGTYEQRRRSLLDIYYAFLQGIKAAKEEE